MRRWLPASAAQQGVVLLVAALCTFLVTAAAGTSLWLRTSADAIAGQVFSDAPVQATQLQVSYDGVRGGEVPPRAGEEVDAALPEALRTHFAAPRSVAVSPSMVPEILPPSPGEPAYLTVAGLPDPEGEVELVDGRMPVAGDGSGPVPAEVLAAYVDPPRRLGVVEVALEERASEELEFPLGSWVKVSSSSYRGALRAPPLLHVVGIIRATRPYPSAVDDLESLRAPLVSDIPDLNVVRATALAADEETVLGTRWTTGSSVRFTFDPAGEPVAGEARALVEEGRQVQLQDWPDAVPADSATAATGVSALGQEVLDQRRASDGLVALTLTALAAGALTVLLAAALVLASRRSPVTTVVRARGASGPWLVARRGAEAALLVAPGLVVALGLVAVLDRGLPAATDALAALAAAAACTLVVTAAQVVPRPEPGGSQLQAVLADALQLVAVLLAAGVSVLVLVGGGQEGGLGAGDPLLLVLPPLLGVAAAVVVVRGLQVVLGALRRAARRTRPAAPLVALSQASAVSRRVVVAATALVLAVSSVVLAVAATDTLHRGAEQAAQEEVGADLAVRADGLRPPLVEQLAGLDGVRRVAPVFTAPSVSVETLTGVEGVTVVGVDPAALAEVGGTTAGLDLSPREDGTLPMVASSDLELEDGRAELLYAQSRVDLEAVATAPRLPGLVEDGSFVLVDLAALEAATERTLQIFTTLLVSGSPDVGAVRAAVAEVDPQAGVVSRTRVADERLDRPALARTVGVLAVAAVAAAALAVFGTLLTSGLGAPERRRTAAVLGVLGGTRRQARRAGVVALLPVVGAASLAAAACGVLLTAVAGSGFDLAGLVGAGSRLAVRPDPVSALLLAAGLLVLVALAALAAARTRTDPPDSHARPDRRPDRGLR